MQQPVLERLDAARVPDGTPLGSAFSVLVYAKRGTDRVPVPRSLYRASGNIPVIVDRRVRTVSGARHQHRPSADASVSTGSRFERADPFGTSPVQPQQWASQQELPFELHGNDVGWLPGPVGGNAGRAAPPFTGTRMGVSSASGLTADSSARAVLRVVQFTSARRFIKWLIRTMQCPRDCSHAHDATRCKRWCWTCLHKGAWELVLWRDGSDLVICLSDCTSAMRVLEVGWTTNGRIVKVQVPEAIGIYTTFGRQATDVGDQHRKRICLGGRRDFALAYYSCVVGAVSMRRRVPAEMALCVPCDGDAAAARQAVRQTRAQARAHVPRCPVEENRRKRRAGEEAPPRWAGRGYACVDPACVIKPSPTYICMGCREERERCSGWYHLECFFRWHSLQLRSDV